MFELKKTPGKDYVILNLTDPQLQNVDWNEKNFRERILVGTVRELYERVKPDLVTVSGDIGCAGQYVAYESFADMLDSYQVPWAPVWGNHDDQGGNEPIEKVVEGYLKHPYCIYEKGDPEFGNGNYIINITENDKIVENIFMLDSHDREYFINEEGKKVDRWAKLWIPQLEWYASEIENLKKLGSKESMMVLHIPIYAYQTAANAAFRTGLDRKSVEPQQSSDPMYWNPGYEDSFGVMYEGICSYPNEDHAYDYIKKADHTKTIIAGHDHVNNFVIKYDGVRFIYSLKTGAGCYWNEKLSGGTVITIGSDGVKDVYHEYVDGNQFLDK